MKSVYIHIPFCNNICSYCDFTKMYNIKEYVDKYLKSLSSEIKTKYHGEIINTLYIGGGTPSCLSIDNLKELFKIIDTFNLSSNLEFTIECNINDIEEKKLKLFKKNKVNRLSIGVQTFNEKYIKYLNRSHTKEDIFNNISLAKKYFDNINVDLIYAIPNQTLDELKSDIDNFIKLNIPHISTYSLMIEPHTILSKEDYIDDELDYQMYQLICNTLKNNNYRHYEVSNFSKQNYESKHNLTYWNNENYYGFGLSASGYINNIRYTNTKNLNDYLKGKYLYEKQELTLKQQMQEEMFLGLRKLDGVDINKFKDKYHKKIEDIFNIKDLIESKKLIIENNKIRINEDYIYVSNDILINFVGE